MIVRGEQASPRVGLRAELRLDLGAGDDEREPLLGRLGLGEAERIDERVATLLQAPGAHEREAPRRRQRRPARARRARGSSRSAVPYQWAALAGAVAAASAPASDISAIAASSPGRAWRATW